MWCNHSNYSYNKMKTDVQSLITRYASIPVRFPYPKAVAADAGSIYIGYCGRSGGFERIERPWTTPVSSLSLTGYNVPGIAALPDGGVCLTRRSSSFADIAELWPDGSVRRTWGGEGALGHEKLHNPQGMAVGPSGNFYVVEANRWGGDRCWDMNRLLMFSARGDLLSVRGGTGNENGRFNLPVGVAVDQEERIYVADTYNCRIQVFADDGSFLLSWGEYGRGPGRFDCPQGVAVDAAARVYVADTCNNRMQMFSSAGVYLAQWGGRGDADGEFRLPCGVAAGGDGTVYVADTLNQRIQSFRIEGETAHS